MIGWSHVAWTFPLVVTVAATAATAVLLVLWVVRSLQHPVRRQQFDVALAVIHSSELEIDTALNRHAPRPLRWWNDWFGYWARLYDQAGHVVHDRTTPGKVAAGVAVFGGLLGWLVLPGPVVVVGMVAAPVGLRAWLGAGRQRRIVAIDRQLPALLAALRSHLQAGSTAQQAMIAVADDLPSPLGDEMRSLQHDLQVNVPLELALRALASRVPSREMQFLVASTEIAVRSGADLDPQLAIIEDMVARRTRIRAKLRSAIAQVKPTQLLAYAAVPTMFLFTGLRSSSNRAYWFGPGLVWLVIAGVLYVSGGVVIRLMVKSVENT